MTLFSFELVIFIIVSGIILKIKKSKPDISYPQSGLKAYLTPDIKLIEQIRKNQKGNQNKFQKKLAEVIYKNFLLIFYKRNPFLKYPQYTTTWKILGRLSYSIELEILTTCFIIIVISFGISNTIRFSGVLESRYTSDNNTLFYLMVALLIIIFYVLNQISGLAGFQSYEAKIAYFGAFASAILAILLLTKFDHLIDIDLETVIKNQNEKFTDIFNIPEISKGSLVLLLGIITAFTNFGIISIIIKHGNCYSDIKKEIQKLKIEIMEKTFEKEDAQENGQVTNNKGFNTIDQCKFIKQQNRLFYRDCQSLKIKKVPLLLFLHVFISYSFKLYKHYVLVQTFHETYQGKTQSQRGFFYVIQLSLMYVNFRFEIQRFLERPIILIKTLLDDPSKKRYNHVVRKAKAYFNSCNIITIQVLSKIMIPGLLLLILITKNIQINQQQLELQQINVQPQSLSQDNNPPQNEYQRIKEEVESHAAIQFIKLVSKQGLLTLEFQKMLIEFFHFEFLFVNYALQIFYLAYKRKTDELFMR